MKCQKCGTQLENEARFCGACGTPVTASLAPAVRLNTPVPGGNAPVVARPPDAGATTPLRPSSAAPPAAARPVGNTPAPQPIRPAPTPAPAPVPVAAPAANGDPYVGRTLNNRYMIEAKLGEGGFGAVYKAKQVQIGRLVALKLLHPDTARDPNLVARFRREGAVACSLKDAHTITTYDFDQTPEGVLYIAMELLTGRSLHEIFHAEAPLHWMRVVKILEQMCSSLGEAHQLGVVHRDLKPENIYLEKRPGDPEFVKILDFGIAKIVSGEIGGQSPQLTASGQTLGTLEYMSPEQLMGKPLDGRSDVYAMGVLGYELLTARLPFPDAVGPAALIAAQLKKTPEPPSVARPNAQIPPGVDQLILKMVEKDKNKRHADVATLAAECRALLTTGGAAQGAAAGAAGAGQGAVSFRAPAAGTPAPSVQAQATPPQQQAAPVPHVPSQPNLQVPPRAQTPPPAGPSTEALVRETGVGKSRTPMIIAGFIALAVVAGVIAAVVLN